MQQSTITGAVRSQNNIPTSDKMVLRFRDACEAAGLSINTMRRLIAAGRGPRIIQLSERRIGIRRADLDAWIESRTSK